MQLNSPKMSNAQSVSQSMHWCHTFRDTGFLSAMSQETHVHLVSLSCLPTDVPRHLLTAQKEEEVAASQPPTWSHHRAHGTSQVTQSQTPNLGIDRAKSFMNLSFLIHNNFPSTISFFLFFSPPQADLRLTGEVLGEWPWGLQLKLESAELIQNITRGDCCDRATLQ